MGKHRSRTEAALKRLRANHDPVIWGPSYKSGHLLIGRVMPAHSRPTRVLSPLLGREVYVQTEPQRSALFLGFYSQLFTELHEGRMAKPEPGLGPLTGYPPAEGLVPTQVRGTIEIASELGRLKWHPTVRVTTTNGRKVTVAFPYLGHLLWIAHTPRIRCVQWSVADQPESFRRPFEGTWPPRKPTPQDIEEAEAKALILERYYRDVSVPTVEVAESEIPWHLRQNLRALYYSIGRQPCLENELRADFVNELCYRMKNGTPALTSVLFFLHRYGGTLADYTDATHQAVWKRELRVDLFRPFLIDTEMHPETQDVLQQFKAWFNPSEIA